MNRPITHTHIHTCLLREDNSTICISKQKLYYKLWSVIWSIYLGKAGEEGTELGFFWVREEIGGSFGFRLVGYSKVFLAYEAFHFNSCFLWLFALFWNNHNNTLCPLTPHIPHGQSLSISAINKLTMELLNHDLWSNDLFLGRIILGIFQIRITICINLLWLVISLDLQIKIYKYKLM